MEESMTEQELRRLSRKELLEMLPIPTENSSIVLPPL